MYKLYNMYCIPTSISPLYCNAELIKLAAYTVYVLVMHVWEGSKKKMIEKPKDQETKPPQVNTCENIAQAIKLIVCNCRTEGEHYAASHPISCRHVFIKIISINNVT